MVYGDFKSLPRRITCDKVLRDKAFNIVKNPICNGNQKGIASKIYKFFDKRSSENGVYISSEIMASQQITEEIHKEITRIFFFR